MTTKNIAVTRLEPHPDNPRLFLRENVVAAIEAQIAESNRFEEHHALAVRRLESENYQIISGHQRFEAAKRAGVKEVPCHVLAMTDEEALREILFSNAQSDLAPLEIGLHVLKTVGKGKAGRGNKNGIAEYARKMGCGEPMLRNWVLASQVANKSLNQLRELLDYTTSLSILHRAPEEDWTDLVGRMLAGQWTKEETERYVDVIKALEVPEDLAAIFPRSVLRSRFFNDQNGHKSTMGRDFSQSTLEGIVKAIHATESLIDSHPDAKTHRAAFRAWLTAEPQKRLDLRQISAWRREWEAKQESDTAAQEQQWNCGDWRKHIDLVPPNSVALLLTDPPYGIDHQSGRAVTRQARPKIANDTYDQAMGELTASLQAFFPKLKTNAHLLCFCHWKNECAVRETLVACGYTVHSSLIWVKESHGSGDLRGAFAPIHERIVHAVKGSPLLLKREDDVLEVARSTESDHPTEKPVPLLLRLIDATTVEGELVADPFAGVASTLVAAKQSGRTYWGCELDYNYFRAGAARLSGGDR
jgi:site-specific DNA-methyltransferase (adenine-specific)